MEKIIGLDLGTNSIGWAIVRHNDDSSYTLLDKGVNIFQDGVAHDKSGEKPAVQERTAARASRRHYFRRRLRKIQLLKILVRQKMCPYIPDEDLDNWKLHKKYPVSDDFMAWQKTDEVTGKNPYHDRYRCLTEVLDMNKQSDRYSLGRALYHIAQRRGFLSNRKESTKESDGKVKSGINDLSNDMKNAGCEYLGEYFYKIYGSGQKIRTRYTSRADHYKKEFDAICARQKLDDKLKEQIEKAIFFQRPLKSQKGLIGKCTFEKSKSRCPISHPRYEEFRMLAFINNIRIKVLYSDEPLHPLNSDEIEKTIPLFYRKSKPQFNFEDIAKAIAGKGNYSYYKDKEEKPFQFNFKIYASVQGSPVTSGLKSIFGEDWEDGIRCRYVLSEGKTNDQIINDVWHVLFSFDNDAMLCSWAMRNLGLSEKEADCFCKINIPQGYASLSLCAINKILPHLRDGYRYDEAVIMANLPAVTGHDTGSNDLKEIQDNISIIIEDHSKNPLENKKSIHDSVEDYLRGCRSVDSAHIAKLYHPSMIELYPHTYPENGIYRLGSPRVSAIRNPMAMRSLFRLRKLLNELLRSGKIDPETTVRIEFARGLNDSNMRKAIEDYQREQKKKRDEARSKIQEHFGPEYGPSEDEILKYILWEEQKHKCPYTGSEIGFEDFIGPNPKYDIEHTVPRSLGGDNSQMNLTLCESQYNREVKRAALPANLPDHNEIMARIESFKWQEEAESLKKQIERTKTHSATKEDKDKNIQRRHYLKMKLDYLEGKLRRFTMTEVPEGFSNRQGVDVGIIGRYARLYLKSVFQNVYTIKGATTAEFRKMWGLQEEYAKKERDSYANHCIDAITIACIGKNEYEEWARFRKAEESYRFSRGAKPSFPKPWPSFTADVKSVADSILVPHYTASNLPKHTKKKLRKKGKIQYNAEGKPLYIQGDTSRCSLHEATFYGAIKKDDEIKYVVRKSLDSLKPEDLDKIVDDAVRKKIKDVVQEKTKEAGGQKDGFKEAMSGTIWMNEALGIPIKKVRISIKDKPIQLKTHRDKSQNDYKRFVNVKNDSNYCMAIYEGSNDRGKAVRSYSVVNNLNAVKFYNGKTAGDDIIPLSDKNDLPLKCILRIGTMILFYEKSPEELYGCSVEELSKRLYKIIGLSSSNIRQGDKTYSYGMIVCRHHLEARKSSDLKEKKGLWVIGEAYRPLITISYKQFNAYVEGLDFELSLDGQIKFKH